ncbi:MAG TPA: hypothetical protein VGK59_23435 [Ohtaekwangia sp.]
MLKIRYLYTGMKVIRSISIILLAVLSLVASTRFTVGMHFCMGEIKSVALFTKAPACFNEKEVPPCHRKAKPCCEDQTVVHEEEDFKLSASSFYTYVPVATDIERPAVFVSEIIPAAPLSKIQYHQYDPPLRTCDITVAYRVFLI